MLSFIKRAQPLQDVETQQREAEAQFLVLWEADEVEGWEEESAKSKAAANGNGEGIWCAACEFHIV